MDTGPSAKPKDPWFVIGRGRRPLGFWIYLSSQTFVNSSNWVGPGTKPFT